jgi:ABC-type transport system involved in multi-copper enzyme maturation permease subunit
MNRVLIKRSIRDSWALLASCAVLLAAFVCVRVWFASKIELDALLKVITGGMKIFERMLPVPIQDLASPLGRAAFGFEELPTILLLGLWTVARGSECLAGRVGAGTMEMLLAQPIRRLTVVSSHTIVTLGGVVILGLAGWLGTALGLAVSVFETPPAWTAVGPAIVNFLVLGVFQLGAATLVGALARTRALAVAIVIGFYVIELALMIVSRIAPSANWLGYATYMTLYEPTKLSIGVARDPAAYWPLFWQYNLGLLGLGLALLAAAAALFCRRDVPAPL